MSSLLFALGKPLLVLLGGASFFLLSARNVEFVAPPEVQQLEARPLVEPPAPLPELEEQPKPQDDDDQE